MGLGIERVADLDAFCDLYKLLHHGIAHGLFDHKPRARVANLALVVEDAPGRRGRRGIEVGSVGQDDVGRLAAALKADPLEVGLSGTGHEQATDFRRPRKGDRVDIHVQTERTAGNRAKTRDDIEDPIGNARLASQLGDTQRRKRRLLGGFEHERIARRENRRDLPHRHQQWKVPRHDRCDHAERLAAHQGDSGGFGRGDLVVNLVDCLAVPAGASDRKRQIHG